MVVMVTGPSFNNISWRTYIGMPFSTPFFLPDTHHCLIVFAALNAFIIPVVYFFFPETAGRSLEGTPYPFSTPLLVLIADVWRIIL